MLGLVNALAVFLFCLLAALSIAAFAALPNKLPTMDNLFLYFAIFIVERSLFTILSLDLHRLVLSDRMDLYICGLVGRAITFPILLLLFVNLFHQGRTALTRWLGSLSVLAALYVVLWLGHEWGIAKYANWTSLDTFLLFLLLLLVSLALKRGYQLITE